MVQWLRIPCNAGGVGSIPDEGAKIPHVMERLSLSTCAKLADVFQMCIREPSSFWPTTETCFSSVWDGYYSSLLKQKWQNAHLLSTCMLCVAIKEAVTQGMLNSFQLKTCSSHVSLSEAQRCGTKDWVPQVVLQHTPPALQVWQAPYFWWVV